MLSSVRTLRTTAAHRGFMLHKQKAPARCKVHLFHRGCRASRVSYQLRAGRGTAGFQVFSRISPARKGTSAEVMYNGRASVHQSRLTNASRARQFCLVGSGYRRTTAAGPEDSQVLCLVSGNIDSRRLQSQLRVAGKHLTVQVLSKQRDDAHTHRASHQAGLQRQPAKRPVPGLAGTARTSAARQWQACHPLPAAPRAQLHGAAPGQPCLATLQVSGVPGWCGLVRAGSARVRGLIFCIQPP